MRIGGVYSFKGGEAVMTTRYPDELAEVQHVIHSVDANLYKTKISYEKTKIGRVLYHPKSLNIGYRAAFAARVAHPPRVLRLSGWLLHT